MTHSRDAFPRGILYGRAGCGGLRKHRAAVIRPEWVIPSLEGCSAESRSQGVLDICSYRRNQGQLLFLMLKSVIQADDQAGATSFLCGRVFKLFIQLCGSRVNYAFVNVSKKTWGKGFCL